MFLYWMPCLLRMIAGKDALMKQLEQGKFCLRDMYNQFTKVLSMGSMSKLMGMVSY